MGDEYGPLSTPQLIDAVINNTISSDTDVRKDTEPNWTPAMHVKGLLAAVDKRRAELETLETERQQERQQKETERQQKEIDAAERGRRRWDELRVSTCGPLPGREYRVIDTVFAMDSSGEAGFFFDVEADPDDAFSKAKEQLRRRAFELGADAVVSCQFEYRVAASANKAAAAIANFAGKSGGHSQCIEIFAYGTAVSYT